MVDDLAAGVQQQNSQWTLRRASFNSSSVRPFLVLLLTITTFGARVQQLDPAACYLEDAQQQPAVAVQQGTCNATCRAETLQALKGVYAKLGGPMWNFDVDDEPGEERNQGGWMECPAGGCRPDTV